MAEEQAKQAAFSTHARCARAETIKGEKQRFIFMFRQDDSIRGQARDMHK
jgi:hypothetical protein